MTEFVDTNVLIYAHDAGAPRKHKIAMDLLERLFCERTGVISIQVLVEFYYAAVRKLPLAPQAAEQIIADLSSWTIHRPAHADVLRLPDSTRIRRELVGRPHRQQRDRGWVQHYLDGGSQRRPAIWPRYRSQPIHLLTPPALLWRLIS